MNKYLSIKAKIYQAWPKEDGIDCYAKVEINNTIFISTITVKKRDDEDTVYVFMPSKQSGKGYYTIVEFNGNYQTNPLFKAIREACISALEVYENSGQLHQHGDTIEMDIDDLFVHVPLQDNDNVPSHIEKIFG
jgi:DNA-binding cell septation regulator SpoVG